MDKERKKTLDDYLLRKTMKWATFILGGLFLITFFVVSFSSYVGWIPDNGKLGTFFFEGIIAVISFIVGFAFGIAFEQSSNA